MTSAFTITEIDVNDDAALGALLAFEQAHGTPRFDRADLRANFSTLHAGALFVARDDETGKLIGTAQASIWGLTDVESIAINLFALPRRSDVLRALTRRIVAWDAASQAASLVCHVTNATDQERADLEAAGLTHGNERSRVVRRILEADRDIDIAEPEGIRLTSMAEHPEAADQLLAVFNESLRDVPTALDFADESASTLRRDLLVVENEPWPARIRIALDGDRLVGFAAMAPTPAAPSAIYGHRLTGVTRSYRGRGIAAALKRDAIRWAAHNGVEQLVASNDEDNTGMLAINDALGYETVRTISLYTLQVP